MRRKNLHPESLSMTRRVLMTADNLGGVWTYALELARALGAYGVQVALATMGSPLKPGQIEEARQLRNLEVFEKPLKLEWMEEPWEDVESAGAWLLELERQFAPDIVQSERLFTRGLALRRTEGGGGAFVRAFVVAGGPARGSAGNMESLP